MQVGPIDAGDEDALAQWFAVLQASDRDLWPDLSGYTLRDIRALARFRGSSRRHVLLAAAEPGGPILGVGLMEFPLRDNRHSVEVTVAVHPASRRRGAGSAIVERMGVLAAAAGRRVLNSIVDVPVTPGADHASASFAPKVGFVPTLSGNIRHLALPVEPARLDTLRAVVAGARAASAYDTFTFAAPWPEEFVDDHCELLRRMSTDEPAGDGEREEEVWDAERLGESEELRVARGADVLVAVARHRASGRLVALSELLVAPEAPRQAWQLITVVHPEHRGHRLGLAVKLANLEALAAREPTVRVVITGNASVNTPMIAVNDMLGFVVASEGCFWQKRLGPA
jgi:GNAT superfamily N-acetyltransferase